MTLASLSANVDFSQWSLSISDPPDALAIGEGNIGMAMLFDTRSRGGGWVSSYRNAKDHWR